MAMKKSPLYWTPAQHLGASHLLKHQAPALVGRLPHIKQGRANSFRAAAKVAAKGMRAPGMQMPKPSMGLPPMVSAPKMPSPPVARMPPALGTTPPAGSAFPSQMAGGLAAKAPVSLNTSMPGMPPKLP